MHSKLARSYLFINFYSSFQRWILKSLIFRKRFKKSIWISGHHPNISAISISSSPGWWEQQHSNIKILIMLDLRAQSWAGLSLQLQLFMQLKDTWGFVSMILKLLVITPQNFPGLVILHNSFILISPLEKIFLLYQPKELTL